MTRDDLIGLLVDATPNVPVTDDADVLCRAAAAMLDARDAIVASATALDGTLDPTRLAVFEARDRAWSAALGEHHTRVARYRASAGKARAYARQIPRR